MAVRFNFELKPGTARQFHLCHEVQPAGWFKTLNAPEIQRIARGEHMGITPAPAQPCAACKEVQEATNLP